MFNKPLSPDLFTVLTKSNSYAQHTAVDPPLDALQTHAALLDLPLPDPQGPSSSTSADFLKFNTRLAAINAHLPPQDHFPQPPEEQARHALPEGGTSVGLSGEGGTPVPLSGEGGTSVALSGELQGYWEEAAGFMDNVDVLTRAEVRKLFSLPLEG